jgi:hypothetical protein
MCFSPVADLAGGAVVGAIGVDTVRHVGRRADWPLAALPLIFAGHFLTETFVWWGHDGDVSHAVEARATWLYLLVALVVVPFIVPIAVTFAVPDAWRRRAMTPFCALGGAIAAVMLVAVVRGPVTSQVQGHHIAYGVNVPFGGQLTALYVVATCGVMLASRDRVFVAFGMANLVVVALLGWLMVSAFISLWCAWAAVTSVAIDVYIRRADSRGRVRSGSEPSQLRLVASAGYGFEP